MKNARAMPNTHAPKNIRRTIERMNRQKRASVENKMFYQSSREWAVFHDNQSVVRRRQRIAQAVPEADFVPGIVHEGHPLDGLDAGKTCSCG